MSDVHFIHMQYLTLYVYLYVWVYLNNIKPLKIKEKFATNISEIRKTNATHR